ncbi:MAG: lysophospholipid acyltransferase family protein [Flavobacteriales bacterium]|nr:lysophospholipid acyltransferase family protein [Flavobacteriales bacterium]MBT6815016.1 lysophospholipid acyltransferase family protein [Flavobacteriales bacterium]MBT7619893.1 lysophospholipid acyltransferase family protein [Flavobacteriales bacterium]MBT7726918.1 lysophospholipid acyltransferase family protein [Flavobacteriales bacterium]
MRNFIFKILFYCLSLLPLWCLYFISDFLYLVIYKLIGYRTRVVRDNLKNSFPKKSDIELISIEKKFYHHFFDLIIESIKSISISENQMRKRLVFKNIEIFDKYFDQNKSVVLTVSHYGNWEWGLLGVSLTAKQKMMGVYKTINDSFFNDLMNTTRGRFGADLVEMKDSLRHIISTKDECKIIGLLADQSPVKNESNYWTTFLNQESSVYLGPEKIATKMNYPVLFCKIQKVRRGRYEFYLEELCTNPEKTTKGEITSLYLRKSEQTINENPEFWLWTHRRWKHKK